MIHPSMFSDMEFEQQLSAMGDNQAELIKFIARNQYQMCKLCVIHDDKIKALENRDKKVAGAMGGIGAVIGVAVASAIDFFLRR